GAVLGLHALSPLLTIARGFSIVRRADDQRIITSTAQVQAGDELAIQVVDGQITARVTAR
ncbi:MAG TPA: exodeoxyribonuclease VII large subunit, partial [Ktedonobacteraceae bacterium]|nr:exodeoxyribonuclease VII large subunit [Ktedonobacteraceae bacterium]